MKVGHPSVLAHYLRAYITWEKECIIIDFKGLKNGP